MPDNSVPGHGWPAVQAPVALRTRSAVRDRSIERTLWVRLVAKDANLSDRQSNEHCSGE